jgi:hypothetical protein
MKRTRFILLFWVALAQVWWGGVSPSLAYFAPLQNVTGPTVAQDANTTVTVSVHNPATGQDISHVWTIAGGAAAIGIDQITKSQGIVAWRVTDLINNKFKIVWGVYNPGWAALQGNPQQGWIITETWVWIDYATDIVALNDGVLLFETKYTTTGGQTKIIDYFEAYDPSGWYEEFFHGWMPYSWRAYTASFSNYSGVTTRDHIVKDGVAAMIYGGTMYYALYDGRAHSWQIRSESGTDPTAPQITNATVSWTDNSAAQKRGYDYTTNSWLNGEDTKVMAYFDFWPTPAKPGDWIYFTDMSIGATSWSYNLGDSTTTEARSFYHKYAKGGNYTANQQVWGPAESDSFSLTVPVQGSAFTGALMLLLLGD